MGSLIEILGKGLTERYCDECQNFCVACGGGQKGECKALSQLMNKVGAPTVPVVYGNARADKCKLFSSLEFVDYVERAVAGETLDGAA